jgi:hypothetical protein
MIKDIFMQVIGWAGVVFYVISYALLSFERLRADSITYQLLNVCGGICLVVFSCSLADVPNIVVNLIWIIIALVSLMRIVRSRRIKVQPGYSSPSSL